MADAMAPVFDHQDVEESARLRLRNAETAWSVKSEQSRQVRADAGGQVARDESSLSGGSGADNADNGNLPQPQDTGNFDEPTALSTAPSTSTSASVASPTVTVYAVSVTTTTSTSSTSATSSVQVSTATSTTSMVATVTVDTVFSASPSLYINDSGDNVNDHSSSSSYHDSDMDNSPPSDSLSPSGEDALISAGSIGAFILVSFICWILWRTYKKSKREEKDMGYAGYSAPNAFFSKIPYLGRSQRGWQDLDRGGSPPMYEGPKSGIYSMVDGQRMMPPPSRQGPSSLPQLDTNVSYSNVQPFSASSRETYSSRSLQSPQSGATNIVQYAQSQQQQQQQMPPAAQFRLPTNISPVSQSTNRFMISENATYDPNNAAQYGAGTMQTFNTTSSDRSRMPDPVYNQSELARQASTAYNPNQRAVNRASELSSISSGFGDGDIIMPPPAVLQQNMDPTTYNYGKPRDGAIQSIDVNAPDVNDAQARRDTVYTTTSEDRPARYRSVNSWVDQQTGRVQRHQDDAPPVPALPAEDRYTMMMDDEEPRRVDEAMPQPPVPSLPFTTNVNSTTTTE